MMTSETMTSRITVACGAAFFLMLASYELAAAATYYSDPAAVNGQGDGSAKAPWPKLEDMEKNRKLPQLHGGDTLLLGFDD